MEIKVYYPSSKESEKELERRVAAVYADIVMQYINDLSCSAEQKLALIHSLCARQNVLLHGQTK